MHFSAISSLGEVEQGRMPGRKHSRGPVLPLWGWLMAPAVGAAAIAAVVLASQPAPRTPVRPGRGPVAGLPARPRPSGDRHGAAAGGGSRPLQTTSLPTSSTLGLSPAPPPVRPLPSVAAAAGPAAAGPATTARHVAPTTRPAATTTAAASSLVTRTSPARPAPTTSPPPSTTTTEASAATTAARAAPTSAPTSTAPARRSGLSTHHRARRPPAAATARPKLSAERARRAPAPTATTPPSSTTTTTSPATTTSLPLSTTTAPIPVTSAVQGSALSGATDGAGAPPTVTHDPGGGRLDRAFPLAQRRVAVGPGPVELDLAWSGSGELAVSLVCGEQSAWRTLAPSAAAHLRLVASGGSCVMTVSWPGADDSVVTYSYLLSYPAPGG